MPQTLAKEALHLGKLRLTKTDINVNPNTKPPKRKYLLLFLGLLLTLFLLFSRLRWNNSVNSVVLNFVALPKSLDARDSIEI